MNLDNKEKSKLRMKELRNKKRLKKYKDSQKNKKK